MRRSGDVRSGAVVQAVHRLTDEDVGAEIRTRIEGVGEGAAGRGAAEDRLRGQAFFFWFARRLEVGAAAALDDEVADAVASVFGTASGLPKKPGGNRTMKSRVKA
jgi:hypothetical protein